MLSLEKLFESESLVDDIEIIQESIIYRDVLNFNFEDVPDLSPPIPNSTRHHKDLETLQKYYLKPSLSERFLDLSHEKSEAVFKKYCKENNLDTDFKKIKKLNKQLSKVVKKVKEKYQRLRPKDYMKKTGEQFPYHNIKEMESYSYPSGHTAHAYFTSGILSKEFPNHSNELRTLAELIGQSRIDNAVHYPSDVEYGRYIGELASRMQNDNVSIPISDRKIVAEIFRKAAKNCKMTHSLFNNYNEQYANDLAEFIRRSNEIEYYDVNYQECLDAAKLFIQGFPGEYCSDNRYIRSHLEALTTSAKYSPVNSFQKIAGVHKSLGAEVLERGSPGTLRDFKHSARSGTVYPEPTELMNHIDKWVSITEHPFIRHAYYEWIHPFGDGNGRSGRILLASELDFDFQKVNQMIDSNYLERLIYISDKIAQGFLR